MSAFFALAVLLGGCQSFQSSFDALVNLLPGHGEEEWAAGSGNKGFGGDKGFQGDKGLLGDKGFREALRRPRIIVPSGGAAPVDALPDDPSVTVQSAVFAAQDTAAGVLRANGLSARDVHDALVASRPVHLLSHVRAGMRYEVATRGGELRRFLVQLDEDNRLRVYRARGGALKARIESIPYRVEVARLHGRIKDSFFGAVAEAGGPPSVAMQLSEIFDYVIDFHKDLNEGDRIEALVERRYIRGRVAGFGRVLAAQMVVGGRKHSAIYFDDPDYGDYYTPSGETLRRAFLRSPLRYTRISSRFSRHRFHPLLHIYRPHLGVDYAAPVGTPVRVVADGVVIRAGRAGEAGKMVKIRHGGGYETAYMHLSRYGRGIRAGRKVKQGEVIGYVGATGLATGPHLDYRITYKGRHLDPLKADLPRGKPLPRRLRAQFQQVLQQRRVEFAQVPAMDGSSEMAAAGGRPLF